MCAHSRCSSKHFREYCIIGWMHDVASLYARIKAYLDFCRIEKGLAATSIESYRLDLNRFARFCSSESPAEMSETSQSPSTPHTDWLQRYIDSLYQVGFASRSISRHI